MKLLGNTVYCKTITNKAKHIDVSFVHGADASKLVNDPELKKLTVVVDIANRVFRVLVCTTANVGGLLRLPRQVVAKVHFYCVKWDT